MSTPVVESLSQSPILPSNPFLATPDAPQPIFASIVTPLNPQIDSPNKWFDSIFNIDSQSFPTSSIVSEDINPVRGINPSFNRKAIFTTSNYSIPSSPKSEYAPTSSSVRRELALPTTSMSSSSAPIADFSSDPLLQANFVN